MRTERDLHRGAEAVTWDAARMGVAPVEPAQPSTSFLSRTLSRWPAAVIVVGLLASLAWTVALVWLAIRLVL